MINPDPWSDWKAGKTDGESNEWTDYQKQNPSKVTDLSESGVDPLEAIAGGALAMLIGKGIGAAIGAAFADGGLVGKPKTEREARTSRQRRGKITSAKTGLRLAMGGAVVEQEFDRASNQALLSLVIAWKFGQVLRPELAQDPEVIAALLPELTPEDTLLWVDEFFAFLEQTGSPSLQPVLTDLMGRTIAASSDEQAAVCMETQAMNGGPTVDPEDGSVQLAGGGFLGGNLGIALGAGTDQWNLQRELAMQKENHDTRMKLAKPELDTLDEATAARRSSLAKQRAESEAASSMVQDQTANARLKLTGENSDLTESTLGRLSRFKDDTAGGLAYLNKAALSQYGGGSATGIAFDDNGANVTLSDGRTVQIPQATMDRGAQSLNGKYGFMQDRYSGDIIRTNDKTGSADVVSSSGGPTSRPLSLAQDTSNKQIDISRQRIAGMSPEEIQRRTAKATDTGRPNPDFDPTLVQHVRLANKRKYGSDDWYDQQGQTNQPPAQPQQNPYAAKFNADPKMRGNTLGAKTSRGYQVLDASGKVVGYYD